MNNAEFVWSGDAPPQRLTHVFFKRLLQLPAPPRSATLHLFAHTIYHLRVNGVMLGYGPARSYPAFPEYDTYDLAPHLRAGGNTIAVDVGHTGFATFHHLPAPGAMIAWGEIVCDSGAVASLETPGDWQCALSTAHAVAAPRFSFAIGPVQIYDERLCPAQWDTAAAGVRLDWQPPVVCAHHPFGPPRPRSIPHLTQDLRGAQSILRACRHSDDEEIHSFMLLQEYEPHLHVPPKTFAFAYTYLYSPRAQKVAAGVWWGENYLNGRKLVLRADEHGRNARSTAMLSLRKGWNYFCCHYQLVHGMWDMALALPRTARVQLSAIRSRRSTPAFMLAGPLAPALAEPLTARRMDAPERLPELAGQWRVAACEDTHVSPCKAIAWRAHGAALPVSAGKVREIVLPPGGASLVVDMGAMTLGRVCVDYTAPRGTQLDVGGAEELAHGRPWLFKMPLMHSAERQIARGGRARLESFEPRGARYLELAVARNRTPVTIHGIGMVSHVYPYQRRGWFECSDPFFTTLWEYGWNTLRLCSEDVITDTPWRERTLYGGDLLPEMATALVATGDLRLPRRCVEIFLQSFNPGLATLQSAAPKRLDTPGLIDYPLIIMLITEWLCRLTGDRALAGRAQPIFDAMLARVRQTRRSDGLYGTDARAFIDHHYTQRRGCLCAVNALIAAAFAAYASLRELQGDAAAAKQYTALAAGLRAAINTAFWNARAGAFADVLPGTAEDRRTHSTTANAWALLFGAPAPAQAARVLRLFSRQMRRFDPRDEDQLMSAYGAFYGLGALYAHGSEDLAEHAMRTVYAMMIAQPTSTIWEHAHPEKSLSHAWSTAPNYYLSTRTLGVRLGFPERAPLDDIVIAPQAASLQWARGRVPHPLGTVDVDWRIEGELLRLTYRAPAGAHVTVAPQGRLAALHTVVTRADYMDGI